MKRIEETEWEFKPIKLSELMSKKFPEQKWIIEPLIPQGGVTAISGSPASYKTWLILDLALSVARGEPLFEKFPTVQAGVLIIDEESGEELLQERVGLLRKEYGLPIYSASLDQFKLTEKRVNVLMAFIKENNIGLVIFDSLVRIHSSDENSAGEMANTLGLLKQMTKLGLTVIFAHHNRKGSGRSSNPSQEMRGSSDILALVDCHLAIERRGLEEKITVIQTKLRRRKEIDPFELKVIDIEEDNVVYFELGTEPVQTQNKSNEMKETILKIVRESHKRLYGQELFNALRNMGIKGSHSTFKNVLSELIKNTELYEEKGEKNKTYYTLTPFDHELE